MADIDKDSVAARFGARAHSYEAATPVQEAMAGTLMERIQRHFAGRAVRHVLELGCGTGRLTRQLDARLHPARLTAIDIAPDMVAHARAASPCAEYLVADAEDYLQHLGGGEFDLVVSNATIQWFDRPEAALRKAHESLAPGGLLAVATFAERTFQELADAFDLAYAATGHARRPHVVPMRPVPEWAGMLPGLEVVEADIERSFPDVRAFLRSIQEAGAVNSLAGRQAIPRAVLQAMVEQYGRRHTDPASGQVRATYHVCYLFHDR